MVTTIIENQHNYDLLYRPTFLRYIGPSYTHYCRALTLRQLGTSCYECNTVERKRYVVEAFKANPSSSRSLGGDSANHKSQILSSIVTLIPSGLTSRILICTELKGHCFVLVSGYVC